MPSEASVRANPPDLTTGDLVAPDPGTGRAAARGRLRPPGSGSAGTVIVLILVVAAAVGPVIASYGPAHQDFSALLDAPSGRHWLGTDELGRDVFSRLVSGARISLLLGVCVVLASAALGTVAGLVAGFAGGVADAAIMRVADLFLAFPKLILAMAVSASLGPGLRNLLIAVSITWWPEYARLARSMAMVLRHADYVDAARVLGLSPVRILARHVFPSAVPQVLVKATMDVGFAIIYVAGLSFIGLGVQPPTPEWGVMVADGRNYIQSAWWVSAFPGLVILLAGLAFNLMGEAARDLLDPRRRSR